MTRIATSLLALLIVAAPLAARADLWINFKGLYLLTAQRGCHLESRNPATKTSTMRCGPYEMTGNADFTTYTETWGRTTSDPKYGGCASSAWTIALPPAKHQFDFMLRGGGARSPIVCRYAWLNNNTIDVWYTDK